MKKTALISAAVLALFTVMGCKQAADPTPSPTLVAYAAGTVQGTNTTGTIWKVYSDNSSQEFVLNDIPKSSLSAVLLHKNVLYAAGYETIGSTNTAAIWEIDAAGKPKEIFKSTNTNNTEINALAASGDYLYAAGIANEDANDSDKSVAILWKIRIDGTEATKSINLPIVGSDSTYARSIAIDESTVYVAGYQEGKSPIAKVWKIDAGAEPTELTSIQAKSAAYGLVADGGTLYAAGYEAKTKHEAMAWNISSAGIVQAPIQLSDGQAAAQVNALVAAGSFVYAAGNDKEGAADIAKIWAVGKQDNSAAAYASLRSGSKETQVCAIAAAGNTLYAGGYDKDFTGTQAVLWKVTGKQASTAIPLSNDKTKTGVVNAVCAVAQ